MRRIVLADDLSNQSFWGFRRSARLKDIALQFALRTKASLRIIHVDDPSDFRFQDAIYKKYLSSKLSRKIKRESIGSSEITVEYILEEGDPIEKITQLANETNDTIGVVAGTANRYGLGKLIVGHRIEKIVNSSTHPVFVFGPKAIREFKYHHQDEFNVTVVLESDLYSQEQLESIQKIQKTFDAQLTVFLIESGGGSFWRWLKKSIVKFFGKRFHSTDEARKEIERVLRVNPQLIDPKLSLRVALFKKFRTCDLLLIPQNFLISPFVIARRFSVPVLPLRNYKQDL